MTPSPLQRLINLLKIDKKDISQVFFYAIFAGLVSLSLPLGIQAIINLIQSGRVSVSWIVLVVIVIIGVALVGILSLMQLRITENLQQKIFVRSSFEFGYRLPKIKFEELYTDALIKIDEIAERILTVGEVPLHAYKDYLKIAEIKAATNISEGKKAIQNILESFGILITIEREILKLSDKAYDEGTNAMMSDYIREQEKLVWMYRAALGK